jgi:hypothetical protein
MGHPLYRTWYNMMARCYRRDHDAYPKYGGLGVRVHPDWHTFEGFLAGIPPKPTGTTLDRFPDPEGDYAPGNVRWATATEQNNNWSNLPKAFRRAAYRARVLFETGALAPQSGFPRTAKPRRKALTADERREANRVKCARWHAARRAREGSRS